jgi:hypothetical protein
MLTTNKITATTRTGESSNRATINNSIGPIPNTDNIDDLN